MAELKNKIDKSFILRNISQLSIIEHYTQIPEITIERCIETNSLINSPFRYDPSPSVGFRYDNRGKLKMKDFGGFFWGDCFDIVCAVLNADKHRKVKLHINNKEDFKFIIYHIAKEFNMLNGIPIKNNTSLHIQDLLSNIKKQTSVIDVEIRDWGYNCDKYHWLQKYDNILSFSELSNEYIFPVERFWINYNENPEPKYYFTSKDPCYAYYEGKLNGVNLIRLYFPARSANKGRLPKFIANNQVLQRLHSLNGKYDKIVFAKSKKDAAILDKLLSMSVLAETPSLFSLTGFLRVGIIAYPQESYKITDKVINWIIDNHLLEPDVSNLISFLDFDKAGIKGTKYTVDKYGMPFIFLTNGAFGLPNFGAKDISDYLEINGINKTLNLINKYLKQWLEL